MKCNPLRWWWGLLPIAALVWLAFIWEREPIQQDLRIRTQTALSDAGLNWAGTAFNGRDGLLKGLAFKEEHPGQAADVVRKVWGVRVVEESIDLIDFVDQYSWSAETHDKTIVLTGHVPNEETRIKLGDLVQARFPGFTIDDKTNLARGAPDLAAWTAAIGFGLDRLAQLKSGKLDLTGLGISIAGEAKDNNAFKSATAALNSAVPNGAKITKSAIRPPIVSPYTWGASRSATHLILSGFVPGEQQREHIFTQAKKTHPSVVIIDRMETGAGAPDGWSKTVETIVSQIARLQSGEAKLSDKDITLKGKAPNEDTAQAIATEIADTVPKSFRFRHDIQFPEPKPPVVRPFTTAIEVAGDTLHLTGFVPNEAARASLLETAGKAFPDKKIADTLSLGSGEPEGWWRCIIAGVDATGKLGTGTATLSDKVLKVIATTSNEDLAAALPGDVRAATTRACDANVTLTLDLPEEPNLNWRAAYDGNNTVILDGEVPDIETLTLLLSTARKQFPDADIENRMKIAGGYAAKWQKAASHGITLLRLLRRGEARLNGQQLVMSGEAGDTAVATAVKDRLVHNLPKNYTGKDFIEVKSDAMIWAEVEAKRKAKEEKEARRKAEVEEEARRAAKQAEDNRKAEEERAARQRAEEAAAKRRQQEQEEIRRKLQEILNRRDAERKAAVTGNSDIAASAGERLNELLSQREAYRSNAGETTGNANAIDNSRRALEEILAQRTAQRETANRTQAAQDEAKRRKAEQEEAARREAQAAAARLRTAEQEAQRKAKEEAERIKRAKEEAAAREANAKEEARLQAEREAAAARAREQEEKQAAIARDRRERVGQVPAIPQTAFNCQKKISAAARDGVILFESASSELSADSRPTLNELAKIAKGCPKVALAVEGHTDSIGRRGANKSLSMRRSQSVIDYLVEAGISRSRLRPVGYGEEHPVLPNNSDANRARNRRIEFSIDVND